MSHHGEYFLTPPKPATVMALQIVIGEDGTVRAGRLTQIALTADLVFCGDGFNDKTVKVRLGNQYYFVFREHLG
jgi:hypothetical protein